jgi:hypothetical protein
LVGGGGGGRPPPPPLENPLFRIVPGIAQLRWLYVGINSPSHGIQLCLKVHSKLLKGQSYKILDIIFFQGLSSTPVTDPLMVSGLF